jgi:hypothetical protein
MNYVLYETIYTKGLITTQMCFHETNVSSESIKEHINPIINASQTQSLIKRNYIINQKMPNEYRSRGLANCITISKLETQWAYRQERSQQFRDDFNVTLKTKFSCLQS